MAYFTSRSDEELSPPSSTTAMTTRTGYRAPGEVSYAQLSQDTSRSMARTSPRRPSPVTPGPGIATILKGWVTSGRFLSRSRLNPFPALAQGQNDTLTIGRWRSLAERGSGA